MEMSPVTRQKAGNSEQAAGELVHFADGQGEPGDGYVFGQSRMRYSAKSILSGKEKNRTPTAMDTRPAQREAVRRTREISTLNPMGQVAPSFIARREN